MNLYKWLWSKVGGRPYTYILRDIWHKFEFFWIVGLIAAGIYIGHHYDWIEAIKILGVFTAGYIFGHLFWGREYVENQPGE